MRSATPGLEALLLAGHIVGYLAAVFLILRGVQLRVPDQVVAFTDSVVERLGGLVRRPARQASQGRYR